MPFYELLTHLALTDDAIERRTEGELWTSQGRRYVQSKSGIEITSTGWVWKHLWCRA